jgi:membrane associated rhomboid family serine protease
MEGAWEVVPGALGLPFEEDDRPLERLPVVTWLCVLAVAIGSAIGFLWPDVRAEWSLDPDDPFKLGGITLLTSLVLHGGLFHATTSLWFLAMFGDDVEDYLGHGTFAGLLGVAAVFGGIAHVLLAPGDEPMLGAGVAVTAMVAFYALRFPQARLRYFRLFRWLTMPASLAMGFWIFSQVVGARDQISGDADVSYAAHIAAAAVGLWFWFLWRNRD